jgi:hypothetical protein
MKAFVGADVTRDIPWPQVLPDNVELSFLIAKPRLQRSIPKPDALYRKPGMENGHRLAFPLRMPAAFAPPRLGRHPLSSRRVYQEILQQPHLVDFRSGSWSCQNTWAETLASRQHFSADFDGQL